MSDKIKKFIHESNKIERVYSEEADIDDKAINVEDFINYEK